MSAASPSSKKSASGSAKSPKPDFYFQLFTKMKTWLETENRPALLLKPARPTADPKDLYPSILRSVSFHFGVPEHRIISLRRNEPQIVARLALYWLLTQAGLSQTEIAALLLRVPSTIAHGLRSFRSLLETQPDLYMRMASLAITIIPAKPRPMREIWN
jgi:hypothetical protein